MILCISVAIRVTIFCIWADWNIDFLLLDLTVHPIRSIGITLI